MILACPFCQTRYLVSAALFSGGPRRVRCARCSHSWEADLPKEIDAIVPEANFAEHNHVPPPIPPGSGLPALRDQALPLWIHGIIAGGVLILVIFSLLILNRQNIAGHWPSLEKYYLASGLHINHTGEGINIEDVRSELQYESGVVRLVVEGKIHNTTKKNQLVPNILASAMGPDGHKIQSWQIDAPVAKLNADETVPFHASIRAPSETVIEVNLEFTELGNGAE